jgi:hypothetical protein
MPESATIGQPKDREGGKGLVLRSIGNGEAKIARVVVSRQVRDPDGAPPRLRQVG